MPTTPDKTQPVTKANNTITNFSSAYSSTNIKSTSVLQNFIRATVVIKGEAVVQNNNIKQAEDTLKTGDSGAVMLLVTVAII